ncbi:MAG: S41 family peptidase [Candidatus Aceula meridiana]|nr:S41 family peptidase [Candidatus Aceula meridiana]
MKKQFLAAPILAFFCFLFLFPVACSIAQDPPPTAEAQVHQQYLDFFEEIYRVMGENYYYTLRRQDFNNFIRKFDTEIYPKVNNRKQIDEFVRMRSGAYLVEFLRKKEDRFSALFPPKAAEEFEKEALGKRTDLGLKGILTNDGYLLEDVEPRSDAYQKGIRPNDIIYSVDDIALKNLTEEKISELLTPKEGILVRVSYFDIQKQVQKDLELLSQEYFHQTVFPVPVAVDNVFCLEIRQFNRKTSEDMFNFLSLINRQDPSGLILDLRGNPGGPPLAAREIASFFLPPQDEFVYFQRKGDEKNSLDVPAIPNQYRYSGPIVILVNKKSGSASELFSGTMQKQGRATLMGTNTAGQVFLKSMFHLDSQAMLLLVTARGHYPDGEVFSFDGITPQVQTREDEGDLVSLAAGYLLTKIRDQKK